MFNDTPGKTKLAIGCQTNNIYIKGKIKYVYIKNMKRLGIIIT